ncbi:MULTISPECIES: trypsin-like serine peptidase [unclassified Streptomyces]|uniref:trypsin-like serine peptidase n=1 Tax=unclassified Streptomyces TaxID=2593676 RepID=UPI0037FF0D0D
MSSISRLAVAATTAALLAVTATACGGSDDKADAKPSPSASASSGDSGLQLPTDLPTTLPTSLDDLSKWADALQNGGWKDWDKDKWLRDAADFINPIIKDLWDADRLREADGTPDDEQRADVTQADDGTTDPEPAAIRAQRLATPFHDASPATGKLLFDMPDGQAVCSATVVSDPANPGKSNLVWTAGHCVHAGAAGGWYRNIVFVPSFNNGGLSGAALQSATKEQLAPYGTWWATKAGTSKQWIDGGGESSETSSAYPYDFAVLKVTNPDSTRSLEETVGASVPVWFDAPTSAAIDSMDIRGYPAAAPFDGYGYQQYHCAGDPVRLALTKGAPTMHWLGCTMTAGASGGGWFAKEPDGTVALVSNTSIGPQDSPRWLAGPHLGSEAESIFDTVRQ